MPILNLCRFISEPTISFPATLSIAARKIIMFEHDSDICTPYDYPYTIQPVLKSLSSLLKAQNHLHI